MGPRSGWSNFCIRIWKSHWRCCIENQKNLEKSRGMGSIWLDMGSYLVRMKRTSSRKLSKCLPDLWDTIKIKKYGKIRKIPEIPEIHIFHIFHIFPLKGCGCAVLCLLEPAIFVDPPSPVGPKCYPYRRWPCAASNGPHHLSVSRGLHLTVRLWTRVRLKSSPDPRWGQQAEFGRPLRG